MAARRGHSCETAAQTVEWIDAIIDFIRPYTFLLDAHVVNFFKDRLWEAVDKEWIDSLRLEPVENLLQIPSGLARDHWSTSLKEFIFTTKSLVLSREQVDLHKAFPNLFLHSLDNILTQGMVPKKRHEVEVLSAVISSVAKSVGSQKIIDVGAGQGYLAQVLSFQYQLSVVAIDASSHHGKITDARARRIKKHYTAKMCSSYRSQDTLCNLNGPKVVTCQVLSSDVLNGLSDSLLEQNDVDEPKLTGHCLGGTSYEGNGPTKSLSSLKSASRPTLVLAGLHACGDLSVTMLRTFSESKETKAVVSIGCCYNLLSEAGSGTPGSPCGFPMSNAVRSHGLSLGKSSLDLACQSAERWRSLGKDSGLENFELHAFRAAFQMVLCRYYPEVVIKCPTIGRQGKALRRRQQRRNRESSRYHDESFPDVADEEWLHVNESHEHVRHGLFVTFCERGLSRLGLKPLVDVDLLQIWHQTEPFIDVIGPYWSLRAALGPVLESLLLLDRLAFLQEQGGSSVEALVVPLFDPAISPRNVAVVARKI